MAMTESKRIVPQKTDHAGGRKDKGGVFASCAGMNHQVWAGSGISDPGEDLRGAQSTWTVSPKKIESRRHQSNHEDRNQEETVGHRIGLYRLKKRARGGVAIHPKSRYIICIPKRQTRCEAGAQSHGSRRGVSFWKEVRKKEVLGEYSHMI